MMMPTQPTTHLIMIKADFTFGFFKDGFDWPSHAADAYELDHGCASRGIAEVKLDDRRIFQITADNQPDFRARQILARFDQTQESEVADDRSFATFFDGGAGPAFFRDTCHQLLHLGWVSALMTQPQPSWATTMTTPLLHLISVKYHLFSAATPSRKAGESPYNSSAATH